MKSKKQEGGTSLEKENSKVEAVDTSTLNSNPPEPIMPLIIPSKEMEEIAESLKNIPEDIEKVKNMIDKMERLKNSLKSEIKQIEERIKPSKRFNAEKALYAMELQLTVQDRLVYKLKAAQLRNKLSYVVPALEIVKAKFKNMILIKNYELKLKRLRINSSSHVYMRKNEKNIKKRVAKLLNEAVSDSELKESLFELKEYAGAEGNIFNSKLTSFLRSVNEEIYILISGLNKYQAEIYEGVRKGLLNWKTGKPANFEEYLFEEA